MRGVLIPVFCTTLLGFAGVSPATGQVDVTFPLEGFYHPGRYMPVRLVMVGPPGAAQPLTLQSPGAMQTRLPVGGDAGRSLVVPFLAYDGRAQRISWALGHGPWEPVVQPLHVLLPQQRLVGYAGDAGMGIVAAKFFPETICLPLDGVDPLAGSAAAWDTLDALVIDQAVAARLSEERRLSPLLAAGIQIVVRTPQRPDTIWPWLQVGDCWVADPNASSPPAVYDSRVYDVVASWQAGWPADFRRLVVIFAVIFSLCALGLVLWRPRYYLAQLFFMTALMMGALGYWWHFQVPIEECNGQVKVMHGPWSQDDEWAYQTAAVPISTDIRWTDATTKAVFQGPQQLDTFAPLLFCRANGDPWMLRYEIPAQGKVALLKRSVAPRPQLIAPDPVEDSPLLELVRQIYLGNGDTLSGQLSTAPEIGSGNVISRQWPRLIVQHNPATQ